MLKNNLTKALTLTATLLGSFSLHAQEVTDPALLAAFEEIREMGPFLNGTVAGNTGALFAELHKSTDKSGVVAHRDQSYGPDERKNLLDVFTPEGATGSRPVVVFIHGGGLTGGDKVNAASDLMYANIGTYFAHHDMVGIAASYRLVPNITYPQCAEDMKAIVSWIQNNAADYGMNPEQIFFLCTSAGCTHTASLLFDQTMQMDGDPDIAGAIMLSGAYGGGNRDYYGDDADLAAAHSPFGLAESFTGTETPVFLMSAEFDPHGIEADTGRLYALLCSKWERCPRFTQARDHNHLSINQHINTADDRYTRQMVDFIREVIAE